MLVLWWVSTLPWNHVWRNGWKGLTNVESPRLWNAAVICPTSFRALITLQNISFPHPGKSKCTSLGFPSPKHAEGGTEHQTVAALSSSDQDNWMPSEFPCIQSHWSCVQGWGFTQCTTTDFPAVTRTLSIAVRRKKKKEFQLLTRVSWQPAALLLPLSSLTIDA